MWLMRFHCRRPWVTLHYTFTHRADTVYEHPHRRQNWLA